MAYNSDNIFAKIINGLLPSNKLYEDEHVLVIRDKYPVAPVHVLVLPKAQYVSFDDFVAGETPETIAHFFKIIRKVAHDLNIGTSGYRLITNHGRDAVQTVPHFHVHILAGKNLGNLIPESAN
ncbi:histidine triad nucleotide-binding protein [Rickettsiales endosymbiont of Peranema trichophorum]|uniref:histidine triad nucleotide-binding protein n=1 Tax=Rickettsiales endosymbiont of Peranema trichophorum TaxID=2486577 RepID=UPI00102311C8|nr:histidine triad nucleotide-binding protein [Rickettsiales endosymbiont of Peranema trichophorum]RZI46340.1 histidine triad nucleotide-binding protein [Rickettsiales endosymbiont of Peranema trichophorum]